MLRRALTASLLLLIALPVLAHRGTPPDPDQPRPTFTLEKLTDRAYCLFGQGGNVGFLVTDAGVLVVDDQYENIAQGIVDQIRSVTDKPIRYLVNTHYHADHTGGNSVFNKLAEIIAHDSVRPRLLEYPETVKRTFPDKIKAIETEIAAIKDPNDPWRVALEKDLGLAKFFLDAANAFKVETAAPPGLTYEGHVRVWLGGQEVQIFHVAPGHTDGDSMVYFKDQKVLHMGDLFFNGMYPFIDALGGGSVKGYIENIDYAIAHVPPDAKVIAGHGPVSGIATLKRARDFLADLRAEVEKAVKAGMSKADAVRAIRMEAYPEIKPAFRALGNDIAVIYDEIKSGR
ncbi:MAG TPA: MBL fold metallo-hydrolase [Candidatus Polarisedimenticolia bacterium]|jgi:glyoxylase-like metal-dependent hydrolase (beta-lactamase superfamily II)